MTQLPLLNRLLVYRSLGFSLKEIQRLVRAETSPADLRDMLAQRRSSLEGRIEAERARLNDVEARIAEIDREGRPSPYEVAIRSLDHAYAVSLRRTCAACEDVNELLQTLRSKLRSCASAITGHGAIWHRCLGSAEQIDCEALLFLDPRRAFHPDRLSVVKLPACTVASILYDETTDDSRSAYRAAIDRAARLGYRVGGPMRECYFNHAAPGSDVVEAQFPLVAAAAPQAFA